MSNDSINIITNDPNIKINACTLKCDLAFDYGDISDLKITNVGDYLSLRSTATNKPVTYNSTLYIGATDEFDGAGHMIRNITNSSNVTVSFCQMVVEKTTL